MFIKLMSDQITSFWEQIKHGMINTYKIPKEYQQDFALNALKQLLTGMTQCWIGYDTDKEGNRKIHFIMTTKIIDEKYHGLRIFHVDSLYGFRLISEDMISEIDKTLSSFAKANNCSVIIADYSIDRVKGFLMSQGFTEYRTTCRKFLR